MFSSQNLKGSSFRGENLTGADFTNADIRGVDFSNAILINANFSHAIAGLTEYWLFIVHGVALFLAAVSGAATRFASGIASRILLRQNLYYKTIPVLYSINLIVILAILAILLIFLARKGVTADLIALFAAITGGLVLFGTVFGLLVITKIPVGDIGLRLVMNIAWDLAGTIPWTLAATLTGSLAVTIGLWNANNNNNQFYLRSRTLSLAILAVIWFSAWFTAKVFFTNTWLAVDIGIAVAVILLSTYKAWRVLVEDTRFASLKAIALKIATIKATSFAGSNLTNADFSFANLDRTDLSNAHLARTNFQSAKNLELAQVNNTILQAIAVRKVLVKKRAANQPYLDCNFQGANLDGAYLSNVQFRGCNFKGASFVSANLSYADLTESDVSQANFYHANLENANLTKTQAIATNFQRANFTAACLEAWNIDNTTKLDEVSCDYLYLLNHQRERRPSSGKFAPHEFTMLFQKVLHTVDVILSNGFNLEAVSRSLTQLRVENQDTELNIRSIENFGNGTVMVRVNVPENVDKEKIHIDFINHYNDAFKALEKQYQQLRLQQDNLSKKVESLLYGVSRQPEKVVILNIGKQNSENMLPVSLRIGDAGSFPSLEYSGGLPANSLMFQSYQQWRSAYRNSLRDFLRLEIILGEPTNVSYSNLFNDCHQAAENFKKHFNQWLTSEQFRLVKERMLEKLDPRDDLRIILQTSHQPLRRLPWHLWDFCDRYPNAEIALANSAYEPTEKTYHTRNKVRILAILGNSKGINIQKDQEILQKLNAEITFVVEPTPEVVHDLLWDRAWDILFFAGHSSSHTEGLTGHLYINQSDRLTVEELKYGLRGAIARGLKLAIFNSCDGLGLAFALAQLHIPQVIVMREPVPDRVAQEFLKNFLQAYASGKSLYKSVRLARERLQVLEKYFPCATWLPVICQNPAEVPPLWSELSGVGGVGNGES